jgi:hypothetical protein
VRELTWSDGLREQAAYAPVSTFSHQYDVFDPVEAVLPDNPNNY